MSGGGAARDTTSTVAVVAICGARHLGRCLDALLAQQDAPSFDVVVAHDPRLTEVPALTRRYPRVRLAVTGSERTPPELATRAIRGATGDVVLLTEDHCVPCAGWVRHLVDNLGPDRGAVGGTVDARPGVSVVDWAFWYADFSRFATPAVPGPARALTVCNVAYRRADLDAIAPIWQRRFLETEVNRALARRVGSLWLVPSARVTSWRHVSVYAGARERYALGRLFAAVRLAGAGRARRLFWATFAPGLPLLLLARMAARSSRTRALWSSLARALPALTVFTLAWSWGEWVGYVTGHEPRSLVIARET